MKQSDKLKRTSYKKINEETRREIIERILNLGHNVKDVAQAMNINVSTCKAILKVFQDEGRVGKKQKRNKVYNVIETFSFLLVQDDHIEQIGDIKIEESKFSYEKGDDLDQQLEKISQEKAEKMLEKIVESRRKQENEDIQRQMMNYMCMPNGLAPFYPQFNYQLPQTPQTPDTIIKKEYYSQIEQSQS